MAVARDRHVETSKIKISIRNSGSNELSTIFVSYEWAQTKQTRTTSAPTRGLRLFVTGRMRNAFN